MNEKLELIRDKVLAHVFWMDPQPVTLTAFAFVVDAVLDAEEKRVLETSLEGATGWIDWLASMLPANVSSAVL